MIKKLTITIVLAMLCLIFKVNAQITPSKLPRVGDKVPANFWLQEHEMFSDGKLFKTNLSAYKDRLIIFDFWATWCGSCIGKFPLLQELQAKYPDQLKVILVNSIGTRDKPIDISNRLQGKSEPFIAYTLPTIQGDTAILNTFPHQVIPHYIWIMDGEVRAITTADFIDEGNVTRILERVAILKEKRRVIEEKGAEYRKNQKLKTKN